MPALFPIEPKVPPGFSYLADFITEEEERRLIHFISGYTLSPLIFQGYEAKCKTRSFGVDYHFDTRSTTPGTPIPGAFTFLLEKAALYTGIPSGGFVEMLLTEYPPGAVINWHRDGPPFEVIVGISLASDCSFRFRPYGKTTTRRSSVRYEVERRSLYVIRDEAREAWEHSILPVTHTRYSIILRTLRSR